MSVQTLPQSGDKSLSHRPYFKPLTKIIAAYGGPGCGKDELGKILVGERFRWGHLSSSATLTILDDALPLLEIGKVKARGDSVHDIIVNAGLSLRVVEFCKCPPANGNLFVQGILRSPKQPGPQLELLCACAEEIVVLKMLCDRLVAFNRITKGPPRGGRSDDHPSTVHKRISDFSAIEEDIDVSVQEQVEHLSKVKGFNIVYKTLDTTNLTKDEVARAVTRGKFDS